MTLAIEPFGHDALRLALEGAWADDVGGRAALARALGELPGARDALVTEGHALVVFERDVQAHALAAEIEALLGRCAGAAAGEPRELEIDVRYDGVDLAEIATALSITSGEVIARHAAHALTVSFLGFLPGFAYLRGLDAGLARIPRRSSPRARVDAGSVAIAGGMTAVYPAACPGGWNLLGRALDFDPLETALAVGDRVRFRPAAERAARRARPAVTPVSAPTAEVVTIRAVAGPALVVDGAPRRRLGHGAPPGGPLAPSLAARASAAVGNASEAAIVERFGPIAVELAREARGPRSVADDRGRCVRLSPGEEARFEWSGERRVGYVAIEGGVLVPEVLGGRGTILSIGRGGHEGRALRRGDRLPLGEDRARLSASTDPWIELDVIPVSPGPDLLDPEAARAALARARYRVAAASDRTGIRLEPVARVTLATGPSRTTPMRAGAVQAPPSGELVVLGPDHPITGGYPVVGVLARAALEALAVRPVGREVRLRLDLDA